MAFMENFKNSKIFKKTTTLNKTSIKNTLPVAHAVLKKNMQTNAPGYIVFAQRNAQFVQKKSQDHQ